MKNQKRVLGGEVVEQNILRRDSDGNKIWV